MAPNMRLLHDGDIPAAGERVRFVDDHELRALLRATVVDKSRALASAPKERLVYDAAEFAIAFQTLLRETAITEETLASIAAQDGHAPAELIAHAVELASATPDKLVQTAANMRRSFANFCVANGIVSDLDAAIEKITAEKGGYESGGAVELHVQEPKA